MKQKITKTRWLKTLLFSLPFLGLANLTNAQFFNWSTTTNGSLSDNMVWSSGLENLKPVIAGNSVFVTSVSSGPLIVPSTNGTSYYGGSSDVILSKYNKTTGALELRGYIGGSSYDGYGGNGNDKLIYADGYLYLLMASGSKNLPNAVNSPPSETSGNGDLVLCKIDPNNGNVLFTRYMGSVSNGDSYQADLAYYNGDIYIIQNEWSLDVPVSNTSSLASIVYEMSIFYHINAATGVEIVSSYLPITGMRINANANGVQVAGFSYGYVGTNGTTPYVVPGTTNTRTSYAFAKVDPITGNIINSSVYGPVGGGGGQVFNAEFSEDAVYYIWDAEYEHINQYQLTNNTYTQDPVNKYYYAFLKVDNNTGNRLVSSLIPNYNLTTSNGEPRDFTYNDGKLTFTTDHFTGEINTYTGDWHKIEDGGGFEGGAVYQNGHFCVASQTNNANFVTTNNIPRDGYNPYLRVYDADYNLKFSTFYPAKSFSDNYGSFTVDEDGSVYIHYVNSSGFGVTDNTSPYPLGSQDLAIAKISFCPTITVTDNDILPTTQTVCINSEPKLLYGDGDPTVTSNIPNLNMGSTTIVQANINPKYQWQISNSASSGFVDIAGAVGPNYQPDYYSTTKYYRRLVLTDSLFCANETLTPSNVVTVTAGALSAPVVNAGGAIVTCPGQSVTLGGAPSATGTAPFTYQWAPATGLSSTTTSNPTLTAASGSNVYKLTVTDGNACWNDAYAVVSAYTANAGPDKEICQGSTAQIGSAPVPGLTGVTYSWSPSAGLSNPNISQPFVSAAGTYTLTTTYTKTGGGTCSSTDQVTVTTAVGPATNNFAGPDQVICLGDTATLGTPAGADEINVPISSFTQSDTVVSVTLAGLTDNNLATYGQTNIGANKNFTFDLGASPIVQPKKLTLVGGAVASNSLFLQGSNDNSTWSNLYGYFSLAANGTITIDLPATAYRYFRVLGGPFSNNVLSLSNVKFIKPNFTYTWSPGSYLTDNHIRETKYVTGNLSMPNNNIGTYYLTATSSGGCNYYDSMKIAVIEANAGNDGCGPRAIGVEDRTPEINETYQWSIVSGGGIIINGANSSQAYVSASPAGQATTYQLTTSYTLNGVSHSCVDQVVVPDCGCVVNIKVHAPNSCPSYSLNGGNVQLEAQCNVTNSLSSNIPYFKYTWSPTVGLSDPNSATPYLTDNVNRTYTCTVTSLIDPTFVCYNTITVNNPAWSLPVFDAQGGTICLNTSNTTVYGIGDNNVANYSFDSC